MHLLFYCVVPNCTVMMILQCIYTHCNLKVIDTVLIPTGILHLSSPRKLSIPFAHFLHASNMKVMIISSHLSHLEKTCLGVSETWWKTSEYSLMLEISDLESRGIVSM